jgi:hypothetical protein
MRQYLMFLLFTIISIQGFTQEIVTDIFGDLKYEPQNGLYKAYLKENIFDDFVFSDNKGNEAILLNAYIKLEYGELLKNSEKKLDIFNHLIQELCQEENYKATYSVDIFNKVVVKENHNRTVGAVEVGSYGIIERDILGVLEYNTNNETATLRMDIFNNWEYKDSNGNNLTISKVTWNKLKNKFGTEENVFHHLIREFLHI